MIPSKLILAENGEKASEDSSNADAAVCEHEQCPSDDEEIELDWTKEALTFKWYEEPEDWDRLCPADDDADIDHVKTRHRMLYLSFLRLDKLKKMTTIKNTDKISSDQKKEIQDEARRRVGLLLKENDSLWTEQGWSSARKTQDSTGRHLQRKRHRRPRPRRLSRQNPSRTQDRPKPSPGNLRPT